MTINPGNSRLGRILPDVPTVDSPLAEAVVRAIELAGSGTLSIPAFQERILALLTETDPRVAFARWIDEALASGQDQTLARRSWPERDYTFQVLHIAAGEVHPLHCHHNVVSTQVLLTGRLHAREFDRVAVREDGLMRLRPLYDGPLEPGGVLQTTDATRNAHWFAAVEAPATLLNLNIRGYERQTFWPLETRPLGRRLLDPTLGVDGDCLLAAVVDVATAYGKFGGTPLSAFPLALPAREPQPRTLAPRAAA